MNHIDTVRKEARSFGLSLDLFDEAMPKTRIKEQVMFQMQNWKSLGTSVLPSVLFDNGDICKLLIREYANKETMDQALSKLNESGNYWSESIHIDQK